jgi:DNA-directed RNA polymerase subunit RPC12/RpoP
MSSTTTHSTLGQAPALEDRTPDTASIVRAVTLAKCLRCDFEWLPHKEQPVRCGRCRSSLWNVPRAQQLPGKPAPTRKGKPRGIAFLKGGQNPQRKNA